MRTRCHVLVVTSASLLFGAQAHAAATKVNQSDWWGGITGFPSYVNMYIHVPTSLADKPPIVVAPHHCGGDGPTTYSEMSSLVSIATSNGFIMIFPEATGQNCWDAGTSRSMSHGGKGDAPAIVQMVRYALSQYKGDASRVYSVGGSSGGIMTEALLGVFPDVFMAGVSYMGVPCGCWAADYNDVTGKPSNGTGQWSGPCANGTVDKTGTQWGDLVRSYYPGYTGHRPRLQHWHGTADTTLSYKNLAEDIQEWTNVLGLSETPTGTDTPASGTTRQFWKNACGYTVYEAFALSGVAHAVPFNGNAVAAYFGLDKKATTVDPETSACGAGGNGGAGGTSSTGGTSQAGSSAVGNGGTSATLASTAGRSSTLGGASAQSSSAVRNTGGSNTVVGTTAVNTGGRMNAGGTTSAPATGGGRTSAGGVTATGSRNSDTSSNPSTGGSSQSGGTSANGGATTPSASGGAVVTGTTNAGGTSAAQTNGSSSIASTQATNPDSDSGCGCRVVGRVSNSRTAVILLLLGALGTTLRRNPRGASNSRRTFHGSGETMGYNFRAVALRAEQLKHLSRQTPNEPASIDLSDDEEQTLRLIRTHCGPLKERQPTRLDIALAVQWIAELGGYDGESSSSPPGSVTILRGLEHLNIATTTLALFKQQQARDS